MTEVTYEQLDRALRARGFSCRLLEEEPKARVYEHAPSGARVVLPDLPGEAQVTPHHRAAVRATLDLFGIASPPDLGETHRVG